MTTSSPIRDVHFQNPRYPKLGIEILTLKELFDRRIDHFLEAPQRVHFYHIFLFTHGTGSHLIDFVSCQYDDKTLSFVSKGQVQQFQVNRENRGFIIIFTAEFLYQNATELNLFHCQHIFEHALFAPSIRLSLEQHQLLHRLYVQHNPGVGDGLVGFGTAMAEMAKAGLAMEMRKVHRIIGEGDFVLGQAEGSFAAGMSLFTTSSGLKTAR